MAKSSERARHAPGKAVQQFLNCLLGGQEKVRVGPAAGAGPESLPGGVCVPWLGSFSCWVMISFGVRFLNFLWSCHGGGVKLFFWWRWVDVDADGARYR